MSDHYSTPQRYTREGAAKYVSEHENAGVPVSATTLATLATRGGGPIFRKWGRRVVYERADLDAWVASRFGPARASTSGQQ